MYIAFGKVLYFLNYELLRFPRRICELAAAAERVTMKVRHEDEIK